MLKHFFISILFLISLKAHAVTVDGINFEDSVKIGNYTLSLNGIGIRKATFMKIKVYYGALYIVKPLTNLDELINSDEPKQIVMEFVRDVSSNDLKKTYSDSFISANPDSHLSMTSLFNEFNSNFFRSIKKGERMIFTFTSNGVSFKAGDDDESRVFGDGNFSKAIFKMWFINPQDKDLASGMLQN